LDYEKQQTPENTKTPLSDTSPQAQVSSGQELHAPGVRNAAILDANFKGSTSTRGQGIQQQITREHAVFCLARTARDLSI